MLNPGQLNSPVTIESQATPSNAFTDASATWSPFLSTWAKIGVLTSKEVYALGPGFEGQVTHKVTIRYPSLKPKQGMRAVCRDTTYTIQTVQDPDNQRVQLDLICMEVSP